MSEVHKLLPQSPEAEMGVISAFVMSPKHVGSICMERKITTQYFHIPSHAEMFSVLYELWASDTDIDFVSISTILRDRGKFEAVGGAGFITSLHTFLATATNVDFYLGALQEKYILRNILKVCEEFRERVFSEQDQVPKLLDEFNIAANAVAMAKVERCPTPQEDATDKLKRFHGVEADGEIIETGISQLDHYSPLMLGDFPLIVGERKAGKSILGLTIVANVMNKNLRVLYFSLEDKRRKIVDRIIAGRARLEILRQKATVANTGETQKFNDALVWFAKLPFTLYDNILTLSDIVAKIRQHKSKNPDLVLVVIDLAQLVKVVLQKGASREQEVATVSRTLRLLCMELNIIIMPMAHINKDGVTRESQSLEMDCTAIWKVNSPEDDEDINERLISIPIQRNGDSNLAFKSAFFGNIARFENLAEHT